MKPKKKAGMELSGGSFPISFGKPFITGNEIPYMAEAILSGDLSGDGPFTKKCHKLLEERFHARKILLTPSCTAALEMAAILLRLQQRDEVIMPSFTFVSTANAFVLRGALPRFVDIRPDTLNLDETKIEPAISSNTKAIVPVHYAGIAAEMETIQKIAHRHRIEVIEDAAQGVNSRYKNRFLGTIGELGVYSFHISKNVVCGEGGAIVLNHPRYIERAEIIREKGTDRSKFLRGEIDKYTWLDIGSSYLMGDLLAAFLYAQLEKMDMITSRRKEIYTNYYQSLKPLERRGAIQLPVIPSGCSPNYHMFYILLENENQRNRLKQRMAREGIPAHSHYVPLHLSTFGHKLGYREGDFPVTESASARLLRLPFHPEMTIAQQEKILDLIIHYPY